MAANKLKFRRNLFEIENARNLTRDELVATFVPTQAFWRLLSAKNHIVLGARGSGKTALAKMLSHDHLSRFKDDRSQAIISSKNFIGIYIPTRLEWVGGLKNKPWQTEAQAEEFFQWRLNVSTCLAFLITLKSCLDTYYPDLRRRSEIESQLLPQIATSWSGGEFKGNTIRSLQNYLDEIEHDKQQQLARARALGGLPDGERPVGVGFGTDLFVPLKRAISLASSAMDIPEECGWLLCIDEAEFLKTFHHRILNSHLRSYSGNLFFKITTMPYFHHTLETNADVSLDVGHDFEYVYIDQDPILWRSGQHGEEGRAFAGTLFNKRAEVSGSKYWSVRLKHLLGDSELLDSKPSDWGSESEMMALLRKYASVETVNRAEKLLSDPQKFKDQIARKILPALLLRNAVEHAHGRAELDVYSGETMIVRCSDANPRRLIRIFNSLLLESTLKKGGKAGHVKVARLPRKAQTRVLLTFSTSTITRVQSEPIRGPQLHLFLKVIGTYMRMAFHKQPLTTDQISSIIVEPSVSPEEWRLIKRSVGLGLLYPNVSANNPDELPEREGVYHLAYVLAPYFRLLPRRGKPRRLNTILRNARYIDWDISGPIQGTFTFEDLDN